MKKVYFYLINFVLFCLGFLVISHDNAWAIEKGDSCEGYSITDYNGCFMCADENLVINNGYDSDTHNFDLISGTSDDNAQRWIYHFGNYTAGSAEWFNCYYNVSNCWQVGCSADEASIVTQYCGLYCGTNGVSTSNCPCCDSSNWACDWNSGEPSHPYYSTTPTSYDVLTQDCDCPEGTRVYSNLKFYAQYPSCPITVCEEPRTSYSAEYTGGVGYEERAYCLDAGSRFEEEDLCYVPFDKMDDCEPTCPYGSSTSGGGVSVGKAWCSYVDEIKDPPDIVIKEGTQDCYANTTANCTYECQDGTSKDGEGDIAYYPRNYAVTCTNSTCATATQETEGTERPTGCEAIEATRTNGCFIGDQATGTPCAMYSTEPCRWTVDPGPVGGGSCGDGTIDVGEECDGDADRPCVGGTERCINCEWVCDAEDNPCGNGDDTDLGEECDPQGTITTDGCSVGEHKTCSSACLWSACSACPAPDKPEITNLVKETCADEDTGERITGSVVLGVWTSAEEDVLGVNSVEENIENDENSEDKNNVGGMAEKNNILEEIKEFIEETLYKVGTFIEQEMSFDNSNFNKISYAKSFSEYNEESSEKESEGQVLGESDCVAYATPSVVDQQITSNWNYDTPDDWNWGVQTFTPTKDGKLDKLELYMYKKDGANSYVAVKISTNTGAETGGWGGRTSNDITETVFVGGSSNMSIGWKTFDFATEPYLTAGQTYAIKYIRKWGSTGDVRVYRGNIDGSNRNVAYKEYVKRCKLYNNDFCDSSAPGICGWTDVYGDSYNGFSTGQQMDDGSKYCCQYTCAPSEAGKCILAHVGTNNSPKIYPGNGVDYLYNGCAPLYSGTNAQDCINGNAQGDHICISQASYCQTSCDSSCGVCGWKDQFGNCQDGVSSGEQMDSGGKYCCQYSCSAQYSQECKLEFKSVPVNYSATSQGSTYIYNGCIPENSADCINSGIHVCTAGSAYCQPPSCSASGVSDDTIEEEEDLIEFTVDFHDDTGGCSYDNEAFVRIGTVLGTWDMTSAYGVNGLECDGGITTPAIGTSFSCNISSLSLTPSQTYYVQVMASNSHGAKYSDIHRFTYQSAPQDAWYQLQGGGSVYAGQSGLAVNIPSGEDFLDSNLVALNSGIVDVEDGNTGNFIQYNSSSTGGVYNYQYWKNKLLGEKIDIVLSDLDSLSSFDSGIYFLSGDGIISNSVIVNNKAVVILIDGNLTINNNNIEVGESVNQGALMVIVSGNMVIGSGVTDLQGIYVVDGEISTGLGSSQLNIEGSLISWSGVVLQRDLGASNETAPGELFVYRPDIVRTLAETPELDDLMVFKYDWREVAP